jgi:phosphoribosyl 1,2-cyclic phosphodiesterase
MHIRCWGSRGSIPVSGREYLRYGGDTTCLELRSRRGALIVVDAGTGIRPLGLKLTAGRVRSLELLFTHAHWDHIIGFPFFAPLYRRGCTITIRGSAPGKRGFRGIIEGFMASPYFPVSLDDKVVRARLVFGKLDERPFSIGGIRVRTAPLSHPRNGGWGFRFEEGGRACVFLTDNELDYVHDGGLTFEQYADFCRGADLLIHDAEYDRRDYRANRSWGHSLFTDAVELGLAAGVKRLGLFHLNSRRTDDKVDAMVEQARTMAARRGSAMDCFAVGSSFETTL